MEKNKRQKIRFTPKNFRFSIWSAIIVIVASSILYLRDSLKPDIGTSIIANNTTNESTSSTLETPLTPDSLLYLVDKENNIDPIEYTPSDLVSVSEAGFGGDFQIRQTVIDDLKQMREAAQNEGLTLTVISSFRSYEKQTETFNYWVEQEKKLGLSQEEAEVNANNYSAKPGYSEHQLGTAIDFNEITDNFQYTPVGIWLRNNAYKYGFVLSFPEGKEEITGYKFEPWHYRYIGKEAAGDFVQTDTTLNEFLKQA